MMSAQRRPMYFRKTLAPAQLRHVALVALLLMGLGACRADRPPGTDSAAEPPAESTSAPPVTDSALAAPEQATAPWMSLRPEEVVYETYRNAAFDYSIDYPANILKAQRKIGEEGGRIFTTKDGRVEMSVYAFELSERRTTEQLYQAHLDNPKQEITYRSVHDDWLVVSGYMEGDVFYERTILRESVLKTFRIQYDAALRDFFYPITEAISFSFEG